MSKKVKGLLWLIGPLVGCVIAAWAANAIPIYDQSGSLSTPLMAIYIGLSILAEAFAVLIPIGIFVGITKLRGKDVVLLKLLSRTWLLCLLIGVAITAGTYLYTVSSGGGQLETTEPSLLQDLPGSIQLNYPTQSCAVAVTISMCSVDAGTTSYGFPAQYWYVSYGTPNVVGINLPSAVLDIALYTLVLRLLTFAVARIRRRA